MVHSHGLINTSCGFYVGTTSHAIMALTFWHITEGN